MGRSSLSVMCQNWARVKQNFIIPGGAFLPKPDVNVGVVTLTPLTVPYIDHPYNLVDKVISTAFQGKKKNLQNTIARLFPKNMSKTLTTRIIQQSPSMWKYCPRDSKVELGGAKYEDGELFIDGDSDAVIDSLSLRAE